MSDRTLSIDNDFELSTNLEDHAITFSSHPTRAFCCNHECLYVCISLGNIEGKKQDAWLDSFDDIVKSTKENFVKVSMATNLFAFLDAQLIVNRVQNGVLPFDVILHPEHALRLSGVQLSDWSERRFPPCNDRQTILELRPLLREKRDRVYPRKRVRG